MAFITVEELKDYPLPVTDAQWAKIDNAGAYQIATVIDYATQHVKDYIERDLEELEYVERIQGTGRNKMMVNNYPVTAISEVTATDVHGNNQVYGSDAFLVNSRAGIIEFVDRYRNEWFRDKLWTIEYTAGYPTIPGPVKHATALVTIQMLQPLFRGGTNFASIDLVDESNEHIVDMLERYRRVRIG